VRSIITVILVVVIAVMAVETFSPPMRTRAKTVNVPTAALTMVVEPTAASTATLPIATATEVPTPEPTATASPLQADLFPGLNTPDDAQVGQLITVTAAAGNLGPDPSRVRIELYYRDDEISYVSARALTGDTSQDFRATTIKNPYTLRDEPVVMWMSGGVLGPRGADNNKLMTVEYTLMVKKLPAQAVACAYGVGTYDTEVLYSCMKSPIQ